MADQNFSVEAISTMQKKKECTEDKSSNQTGFDRRKMQILKDKAEPLFSYDFGGQNSNKYSLKEDSLSEQIPAHLEESLRRISANAVNVVIGTLNKEKHTLIEDLTRLFGVQIQQCTKMLRLMSSDSTEGDFRVDGAEKLVKHAFNGSDFNLMTVNSTRTPRLIDPVRKRYEADNRDSSNCRQEMHDFNYSNHGVRKELQTPDPYTFVGRNEIEASRNLGCKNKLTIINNRYPGFEYQPHLKQTIASFEISPGNVNLIRTRIPQMLPFCGCCYFQNFQNYK